MRKFILLFASILILASCSEEVVIVEEAVIADETFEDTGSTSRDGTKVGVCHKNAGEIVISESALDTHIAHGDAIDWDGDGFYDKENPCSEIDLDDSIPFDQSTLVDADGDGYFTTENPFSEIDCDDTNAAANPGVAEICNNGIDDNCNGEIDEGCDFTVKILLHCDANSALLDTAVGQGYHALTTSGESYLVLGADVTSVIMTHNNGSTATIYNDANLCAFYNGIWFNDQLYAIEIF